MRIKSALPLISDFRKSQGDKKRTKYKNRVSRYKMNLELRIPL